MGGFESFVRRKRSEVWEEAEHLYEGNGVVDGRLQIVCTVLSERRMGGSGAFVRRKRSGGWEDAERLYGTFGAEDGR